MRTEQTNAYLRSLRTRVTSIDRDDHGAWVVLDASLLYPTSGGQAHDEGWIVPSDPADGTPTHEALEASADVPVRTSLHVVDVEVASGDDVRHRIVDPHAALLPVGSEVEVVVDWPRRFRHMQRHSAQHLLSQAFLHVDPQFETASVSLTSADCTVDVHGEPDDVQVEAAVDVAQGWAYRAMRIDAFEIDEADVARWPLRRPPKVRGKIRLVRMGDVELSACGGTHVASTAEVLPLVALGRKRIRGGLTRITFRAGTEASDLARTHVGDVVHLARSFSAKPDEVVRRVEALQEELAEAKRDASHQRDRWARACVSAADPAGPLTFREDDPASAAALAAAATDLRPHDVLIVGSTGAERATITIQAGHACEADVRPALQAALLVIGGRGGGKRDRAQGSGPHTQALEAALAAARAALASGGG